MLVFASVRQGLVFRVVLFYQSCHHPLVQDNRRYVLNTVDLKTSCIASDESPYFFAWVVCCA